MQPMIRMRRFAVAALLLAVFSVMGCKTGTNPVTGNERVMGYSWKQEKKLGQRANKQIQAQYGFYDEGDVEDYVQQVGQQVLEESHLRREGTAQKFRQTDVTFHVLDSPIVNAFALPGGYVYVSRGLVSHLNNEAQLAVVLSHELGHVAARHASQRAGEQQLRQLGLMGGAILGSQLGLPGGTLMRVGGTALKLLSLRYSRDDERESDKLGVEYATMAGYEASEGAAFFQTLKRISEQKGGGIPSWASTHPEPGDRQQRIPKLAQKWQKKVQRSATTVNRDQHFSTINGMVIGKNPRQGFVQNNTFYHPEGAFQFPIPGNFQVQNTASAVIMQSEQQDAVMQFTYAQAESPRAAAREFAGQEGIQVREDGQASSNGMSAYYVLADAQTQGQGGQQQQVRLLTYFVEKGGTVYQFLGYSTPQEFRQYRDTFERTMRGFDEVNDEDILDVQPARLNVERDRSGTFNEIVGNVDAELAGISERDLAIMNQVELNTSIEPGRPLKLNSN